jgi:hypothetical protein
MSTPLVVAPMGAAQILGASMRLVRTRPALFGGLAAAGALPIVVLALALDHVGVLRGGARPGRDLSDAVLLLAFAAAVALFVRAFFHAAILAALARLSRGEAAEPGPCLRDARGQWLSVTVTGGCLSVLGLASGFLYFVPLVLLGGAFLCAPARVVLDGAAPWRALAAPQRGRSRGKAFAVNFLLWVVAAALFFNLQVLVQLVLALGRALFDLEVSYLTAVLSLENPTFVLVLGGVTLILLEPVRALSGGLLHLEEKVRREGLDLAPRIELLARPHGRGTRVAAALVAISLSADARAGPPLDVREAAVAAAADLARGDEAAGRLRALVERRRRAPGERGAFWRMLEGRISQGASAGVIAAELEGAARIPDPRDLLERVLAGDEFADLDPALWAASPERAAEPPIEEIPLLGPRAAEGGVSGFTLLVLLLTVIAVGAAAAAAFVGLRARRKVPPPAPPPEAAVPAPAAGLDALTRDPAGWRSEADALAAEGNLREALRRLYLAALVALHRARALEYDRSRTNGDYLRRFRGRPEAKRRFRSLTGAFDFVWYGERPIEESAYRDLAREADALLASAAGEAGP